MSANYSDQFVDAVAEFTDLDQSFRDNALIGMVSYDPNSGTISLGSIQVNTANDANTTAFDAFNRIPALIPDTKESMTLAESANRSQVSPGTR